ncbi:MAG: S8 family serine peptidase [Micromonosporaceae bacterium]
MIVQFDAEPVVSVAATGGVVDAQADARIRQARQAVARTENAVLEAAEAAGIEVEHRRSYDVLLPGMSVNVPTDQVDDLRRLPGVAAVHENRTFRASTVDSVPLIGAPEVWERTDPDGLPARGAGVTVAVIDTGIDYTHPALGGGYGPGFKVVGGYDFVNDDADPMDDNAHGTHVAGIIAGSGEGGARAVTGVAPDATLTAYKVLDDGGTGTTEDVLAGIEAAADPANPYRADVINLSLSGPGDGTDPVGLAATRAAESGVVVVAAAGNDGPAERTVGSPAAAEGVLAVGASTSGVRVPTVRLASPVQRPVPTYRSPVSANPPAEPVTAEVVDLGEGTPEDFDRAGDIRGKILLVRGGPDPELAHPFDVERFRIAQDRGALAVIGHFGEAPVSAGELPATPSHTLGADDDLRFEKLVVLGMRSPGTYTDIRELMAAGPVTMTLSGEDATDRIASFSSRGPDPHWGLKPEMVAPGVEIRSSVPVSMWDPGVFRFSGTSMAAPHVAGAAALLRQLWPEASVDRVTASLIGSAAALPEAGPTASGSGRLDVRAAVEATMTADPPVLSFGLADLSGGRVDVRRTLTLRNHGDRTHRVRLSATPAPGSPGHVQVTPIVTVPAGGTATATVRIRVDAPDQLSADVSGWVVVDAPEGTPDVRVPYLLPVRTPDLYVSPDPSDGHTEAFIYTVAPADGPPRVEIDPPRGPKVTVTARHDHDLWWRAPLVGDAPGVYRVTATVTTTTGQTLVGRTTFEVAEEPDGAGWELIGPNSTGGQVVTTPADPDRLVVSPALGAGLWITTDRAATWRYERITPVADGVVRGVAIDPHDADRMWVAITGDSDPTYQGAVVRTDDGGRTWRRLPFPDVAIAGFAMSESGEALYVLGENGSWVSRDGGESWIPTPVPWTGVEDVEFAGEDLYVVASEGLWRWPGTSGDPELVRAAGDFLTSPSMLAVAGDMVAFGQRDNTVWGSTDHGRTWQLLLKTMDGDEWLPDLQELHAVGDTMWADGLQHTFLSEDAGRTWQEIDGPLPQSSVDGLARWPGDDDTLLLGMDYAGVYATDDRGETYTRIGVPGQSADRLAVTDERLLVGTPMQVYGTALPGDPTRLEWGSTGAEDTVGTAVLGLAVAPDKPRTVWKAIMTGFFGMRVLRSDDGGDTWSEMLTSTLTPLDVVVHPADSRRVVVPYAISNTGGLFVTLDEGASWRRYDHDTRFTAVVGDPANPDRLWLGDHEGLWRSDDRGATRVKVADGRVTAIHIDGDRMIIAGDRIRLSTDGGRTFTDTHVLGTGRFGLPMRVSSIVEADGVLYAAVGGYVEADLINNGRGVLRSVNGGRTWVNIGAGLPDRSVRSLAVSPDGQWLFAGTQSGGVYRMQIGR